MHSLLSDVLEPLPVPVLLDRAVAAFPEQPAMSFFGRRWKYRELADLVDRAGAGLQAHGVVAGDRVGLCLPNTPYSVIFYYAALRIGAVVVNYNPLYVAKELRLQIIDSATTTMVVPDITAIFDKVAEVAESCGVKRTIVCPIADMLPAAIADGYRMSQQATTTQPPWPPRVIPYLQLIEGNNVLRPADIDPVRDLAVLQYTGGTTGVPKAAMLTHGNLTINAAQVCRVMPNLQLGQERMMVVLPLFHVFAMTSVLNGGIAVAAELILHMRFDVDTVLASIARDKPTLLHAVPTIYGALSAAAETHKIDIASIRACISGGAPLPAEVGLRFEALTGARVTEGYGLTEASPTVSCGSPEEAVRPGSVGRPLYATEIEIRDIVDVTRHLPVGERGEICVRGPQVMVGYLNRPLETAASFIDGALRTGDIGYLDADGYLYVTDRLKDLIICSGFNVYPRVIEDALYEHPAVAEVIVIGVPDPYRGQAPHAYVTLRPGMQAEPEQLREFLRDHLSPIELPSRVEIRSRLPKTAVGKLSKKDLIAELALAGRT